MFVDFVEYPAAKVVVRKYEVFLEGCCLVLSWEVWEERSGWKDI